jgi:hypothetical protein
MLHVYFSVSSALLVQNNQGVGFCVPSTLFVENLVDRSILFLPLLLLLQHPASASSFRCPSSLSLCRFLSLPALTEYILLSPRSSPFFVDDFYPFEMEQAFPGGSKVRRKL